MSNYCCANCAFFKKDEAAIGKELPGGFFVGECRKGPPRCQFDYGAVSSVWPPVGGEDWCGEFRPSSMEFPELQEKKTV